MPARRAWAALPYNPMPGAAPARGTEIHRGAIHKPDVAEKKEWQT